MQPLAQPDDAAEAVEHAEPVARRRRRPASGSCWCRGRARRRPARRTAAAHSPMARCRPRTGHSAAASWYCHPGLPRPASVRSAGFLVFIWEPPWTPMDQPRTSQMAAKMRRILDRYRVTSGKGFRLKHYDPADTGGAHADKQQAEELLAAGVQRLAALQELLYAQDRWAMLCVFQAMDAAGKDGTIKHVMSGVNPQGVQVTSFKAPGPGGAGARLPLAHHARAAGARPHRHLQPQPLRGGAGGARAPGNAGTPAPAGGTGRQEDLGAAAGGYRRLRALPDPAGHGGAEVLPATSRRRSRSAASWSGWTIRTRTGSSARPTSPSAPTGTTTWRPTRRRSPPPPRRMRRGSWCRRTTSGSPGWWWSRR